MKLDEVVISRAITDTFIEEFRQNLISDVAIVGAGPSGLTAGYYLAKAGAKVVLFEKSLRLGGGMPGGGMMFNKIVVQEVAREILDEMEIKYAPYEKGYYVADALESVAALTLKAIRQGVKIFNLIGVEDVMIRNERVEGLVINWEAVRIAKIHVDPMTISCKAVVDATGHDSEVVHKIQLREYIRLNTPSGKIMGEGPMWADKAEGEILTCTKEVYPGLYVSGMAANAVYGKPRMGPVFGGMLLSGRKVADMIAQELLE